MNLDKLSKLLSDYGCKQIYVKDLSENDNSKNQIYFGPNFAALNILPVGDLTPAPSESNQIFHASLKFSWIDESGDVNPAPHAKIILYPQYPEVRFSGFLLGCKNAPSKVLAARKRGRVLFLGISSDGIVLGFAVENDSTLAKEFKALGLSPTIGVFSVLALVKTRDKDSKKLLLDELRRIHSLGWIRSKRLLPDGRTTECLSRNCGGYTLEAELGITPNGFSEPDYLGWEIKQHGVTAFDKYEAGVITLMTPEPTGGLYQTDGVEDFLKKFGYPDKSGIPNRINFGGVHFANLRNEATGFTLKLIGYDATSKKIVDTSGGMALVTATGEIGALWGFAGLLKHWNRKHAQAAYVPSLMKKAPFQQYSYGGIVRLGIGTDFLRFLDAVHNGSVYYDPGIKMEKKQSKWISKRRNQFRIKSRTIHTLYEGLHVVNL